MPGTNASGCWRISTAQNGSDPCADKIIGRTAHKCEGCSYPQHGVSSVGAGMEAACAPIWRG